MQIIEFDRPPSWSLDASETGDSTKYRPMGRGGGGHGGQKKLGDCNSFTLSCVQGPWGLVPPLIKSINSLLPWSKNLLNQGNMIVLLRSCEFRDSRNRFNAVTKLSQMNAEWKNSSLTKKKKAKPSSSDACCLCYILHFMLILKFQLMIFRGKNKWSFENTSWCWSGSSRWKNFLRKRNSLFLLWHQSSKNYSEIDAILDNAMLCSDELY